MDAVSGALQDAKKGIVRSGFDLTPLPTPMDLFLNTFELYLLGKKTFLP
jgi:hypothetical protein